MTDNSGMNALGWTLAIVIGALVLIPLLFCCVGGPIMAAIGSVTR